MNGLNYDSAELLQKIYTLHKRFAVAALLLLVLVLLIQMFWVFLYFQFAQGISQLSDNPKPYVEGFKTLEQLDAERPKIPKKFD